MEIKKLNDPQKSTRSLTISQAQLSIPATLGKQFSEYKFNRIGHEIIDDVHFDTYEVKGDGQKYHYYENIDGFYGKGNLIPNLSEKDIPIPNKPYPLSNFLESFYKSLKEYGLKREIDLDKITINFKNYASNMVSNYIAGYYPSRDQIDVTAIKEYNREFDYPILHSYNLYKLFIMHQVIHILNDHDFENTETPIRGNYYEPKLGVDCIDFTPLSHRTFVSEFLNYTFWTHQPKAFDRDNEKFAFLHSATFGIHSKLFSEAELRKAIIEAKPEATVQENLFEILDWNNK